MSTFKPTGRKTMTAEITLFQVCIISRAGSEHFLKPQGPRKIVLGGKFGWAVWDLFGGI